MNKNILIKKNNIEINATKEDIIIIEETHDGLNIRFRNDTNFYITDVYMPLSVKKQIVTSFNKYVKAEFDLLTIDLSNYKQPILLSF